MNSIYNTYNPGNFYPINYPYQNPYTYEAPYISNPYGGRFFQYPVTQPRIPTVEDFENSFYCMYSSMADKKSQWENQAHANAGAIEKVQMLQAGIKELQEDLARVQQLDSQIKMLRPEDLYQQEFRYQIEIDPALQSAKYHSYIDYVQQKKSEMIEQICHLAQHTFSWLASSRQTVYHLKQLAISPIPDHASPLNPEPYRIRARQLPHPNASSQPISEIQSHSLPISHPSLNSSVNAPVSSSATAEAGAEPKPAFRQTLADLIQRHTLNPLNKAEASSPLPSALENPLAAQPALPPLQERVKVHLRPLPPLPTREEEKTPPPLPPREFKRTPPPLPPRPSLFVSENAQDMAELAIPASIKEPNMASQAIESGKTSPQQDFSVQEQSVLALEDEASLPAVSGQAALEQSVNHLSHLESARKTLEIGQEILNPQPIPPPPPFIQLFPPQSKNTAEKIESKSIAVERTDGVLDLLSSQLAARRKVIEEEIREDGYESDEDSISSPRVIKPASQHVQSSPSSPEERPTIKRSEDRSDLLSSIVNFNKGNLKKVSEEKLDSSSKAERKDDPKAGTDFADLMKSIIDRLPSENDAEEASDTEWE